MNLMLIDGISFRFYMQSIKRLVLRIITSIVGIFMTMKLILNLMKCKEAKTLFALVGTEKLINFMPIDGISSVVRCNQ